MFDGGYLAVCTARDLGWKRVHGIVHKRSRALEQRAAGGEKLAKEQKPIGIILEKRRNLNDPSHDYAGYGW